jgi:DNA-binding response OmpR family regulator
MGVPLPIPDPTRCGTKNDLVPREADFMRKRVLIVDDEPNIVISLEFLMKREGHEVLVARDGEAGLAAIRDQQPDLVLLDVMMPKRDGFEVCEAVRTDPKLDDVRILMLTAKGREAEVKKGLALGADAYVPKPFSTRELVERVNSLLEGEE